LFEDALKDLAGLIAYRLLTPEQSSAIVSYLHKNINLTEEAEPVLIHNDVIFDHIFVEKETDQWRMTGICDFEFAAAYAREFDFVKLHRAGLLKEIKENLLEEYGKIHPKFDEVVQMYRIVRDIGFARHTAKSGHMETSKKAIENVLRTVNR
jgi:aminoglycoside phosphotransferase (APT) family kinase protein